MSETKSFDKFMDEQYARHPGLKRRVKIADILMDVQLEYAKRVNTENDAPGGFEKQQEQIEALLTQAAKDGEARGQLKGFDAALDTLGDAQERFLVDPAAISYMKNARHKLALRPTQPKTTAEQPVKEILTVEDTAGCPKEVNAVLDKLERNGYGAGNWRRLITQLRPKERK
jgi:hypothetical protein